MRTLNRGMLVTGLVTLLAAFTAAESQERDVSMADRQLAACLIVDNECAVEVARIARRESSNERVRDFAQRMIEDHRQTLGQLHRFDSVRGRLAQTGPNGGKQQPQALDFVRIKQEIGQQCLASAEDLLSSKQGLKFDRCYLGMQIVTHQELIDTLAVFKKYASADLGALIEQIDDTTQQHIERAEQLLKSLESGQGTARGASREQRRRYSVSPTNEQRSRD